MEDVGQDEFCISGIRKLAGPFIRRGDWGDTGVFDSLFSMTCWASSRVPADISTIPGCSDAMG